MTWFIDDRRTWPQRMFGNILLAGPLPKHVAIIMDGNRRYARCKNIKKIEGHMSGFDKLVEVKITFKNQSNSYFFQGAELVFCHAGKRSKRLCI